MHSSRCFIPRFPIDPMNRNRLPHGTLAAVASVLLFAAGCTSVGPDYEPPVTTVPDSYKGAALGQWKPGEPQDHLPRGPWWEVFGDAELNRLQTLAQSANQELKAAFAAVEQARATARVARSEFFPSVDANPSFRRERFSPNQEPDFGDLTASTFAVPLDLSYELDLWGRVRRSFESARAEAEVGAAAFHGVLLTLQADVARIYFTLRAIDAEIEVLRRALDLRRDQVRVVTGRYDAGLGIELDVARAETELAVSEAELAALALNRVEWENALAILVGESPSTFRLTPLTDPFAALDRLPPEIPPGLPSTLLERRPDIAGAERQLAADNARIGIARAAYFPVIRLTGSGGFVSADVESLFEWDSRVWSLGPSVSLPLFAGGRNEAGVRRSRAQFEESMARYRQQVLIGFGEVEDALAAIQHLADRAEAQDRALTHARRARLLAMEGFDTGIADYLSVIDADREALRNRRTAVQLAGLRWIASVQLVKALGGGWDSEDTRP